MKLTDNQLPAAQTSGNMVTLNMGISDNPEDQLMILNVLSSTLYTKKPDAVLREYGCNAYDANVEAGKGDVPIEVGLPNKMEPTLRIRDFGFGMTEEQIANTFVKLGRSTKRNSNEFTGMLGIGSKAGFAYGDSFMVTSYTGGKKVVYNAFRDKGAPRLACMLTTTTNEPDGIEIKVPVRMEHFQEFREKAERVYRYFKVRPKITGASITFNDAERTMSGTRWHYTGSGKSYAIMGNVGYDLSSEGMGGWSMEPKARSLLDAGVELEFDIGELEIAASREGLQYKDVTKKAVLARLKVLVAEVGKVFTQKIAGAQSLWEASAAYGDMFEQMGSSSTRYLRDVVDGQVKWKGKTISTGRFKIENKEKDPEVSVFLVQSNQWNRRRHRYPNADTCYAGKKTVLVINDLPTKKMSPSRERAFFDDPANKHVNEWVLFTFQSDAAQQKYWKLRELEGAPTINLSSIVPAVTVRSSTTTAGVKVYNSKHSTKVFVFDEASPPSLGDTRSLHWKQESADLKEDKGTYVVLENFFILQPDGFHEHPDNFRNTVKRLRAAGLIDGPLYGFKKALVDAKRLGKGWKRLEVCVAERFAKEMGADGILQTAANYIHAAKWEPPVDLSFRTDYPAGSQFRDLLDTAWNALNPAKADLLKVVLEREDRAPWVPEILALPPSTINLATLTKKVLNEYPMLQIIPEYTIRDIGRRESKKVAEYIRLVESA